MDGGTDERAPMVVEGCKPTCTEDHKATAELMEKLREMNSTRQREDALKDALKKSRSRVDAEKTEMKLEVNEVDEAEANEDYGRILEDSREAQAKIQQETPEYMATVQGNDTQITEQRSASEFLVLTERSQGAETPADETIPLANNATATETTQDIQTSTDEPIPLSTPEMETETTQTTETPTNTFLPLLNPKTPTLNTSLEPNTHVNVDCSTGLRIDQSLTFNRDLHFTVIPQNQPGEYVSYANFHLEALPDLSDDAIKLRLKANFNPQTKQEANTNLVIVIPRTAPLVEKDVTIPEEAISVEKAITPESVNPTEVATPLEKETPSEEINTLHKTTSLEENDHPESTSLPGNATPARQATRPENTTQPPSLRQPPELPAPTYQTFQITCCNCKTSNKVYSQICRCDHHECPECVRYAKRSFNYRQWHCSPKSCKCRNKMEIPRRECRVCEHDFCAYCVGGRADE